MDEEGQHSLECIQANQIFPRKQLIREEENLQVPFPELHGESTEYVGRAEDAIIALSNYRVHIKFKESIVNVPLQLIETVECRDIFQLHLTCKDCKVIRCQFSTFEQCQEWLKRLNNAVRPPTKIEDLFSFAYHAWCVDVYASEKEQHGDLCRPGEHVTSRFKNEVERMGFDVHNAWRISLINDKYKLCASYPQELIVPVWITDKELESVSGFRSWKRIPAVVYRHQTNGAVIARCGQPEVSWWGWRNADDEHLVQSIAKACAMDSSSSANGSKLMNGNCSRDYTNGGDLSDGEFDSSMTSASGVDNLNIQPQKLLILDARSYAAAVANRAKGGGCECPEYYPNSEVVFMGMANIHSIRKSFQSLRFLCTQMPDPGNWLSALEGTKWLQHLSILLKSALLVVHAVDRDLRPVLVHCSDGWDRTPQIVALAKLLLDPYYRTIEGFQVLVETEWLDFGHKFADRCGHGENSDDLNERCPVFLQWLDCVHQLQRQFPCSFEFNEAFLVKLVQHTYSCLFGTFLCNNAKERQDKQIQDRTCSVWSLLRPANKAFKNLLYSSHSETVLYPVCHVRNLLLWSAVYLPSSSPSTPADDTCAPYLVPGSNPEDQPLGRLPKTRSFDNLTTACDTNTTTANRRSSDPSLNEKWQEHRRSLELNNMGNMAGTDGNGLEEPLNGDTLEHGKQGKNLLGAELSVAAGVAEGQIVNILQEAFKEEGSLDEPMKACTDPLENKHEELGLNKESRLELEMPNTNPSSLYEPVGNLIGNPLSNPSQVSEDIFRSEQLLGQENLVDSVSSVQMLPSTEVVMFRTVSAESFVNSDKVENVEAEDLGSLSTEPESHYTTPQPSPPPLPTLEKQEEKISMLESSTETLTEEAAKLELPQSNTSCLLYINSNGTAASSLATETSSKLPEGEDKEVKPKLGMSVRRTSNRSLESMQPSTCALHFGECKNETICNGEVDGENLAEDQSAESSNGTQRTVIANGYCVNGEDDERRRVVLSRQVSTASCNSMQFHFRNSHHKWMHSHLGRQQPPNSPDHPARSHLDDDGLAIYNDVIQQRLRQIEAGHQQEVETLKKQVQELRSRLESQHLNSSLRFNGDLGDDVTSIPDSENNLDQNCLSRCSTEIFSEASWEQVDKQDTEVTRWYPDHLAAHCYGCASKFWLASRKHHCRDSEPVDETCWVNAGRCKNCATISTEKNCGNVFCSSCCNQKIPVPSQQLFEPSRVCKFCYTSLQPSDNPLNLELDKPIAASSN
ncbi:myotubularin-related protein 3 isoform X3 [Latimeria chalumnae]|uniref:myotubularin-related protein 3 isoform X3 n=1 Tax=Latimeria chalumnae TaxID=7897 RepID=UPI0003C115C5|nr:PREDICTED: myotubularin-related protein 3 isoform X3 [Latimeria chalumnae]|eukprot:XP_006007536.1 PREDICTED: myotubularin-related protein 3 isoform X3 [Latimeria chalumnae]